MQTHTCHLFIRQTHPTLPSVSRQSFTAAQQIVDELLQYAVCLGGGGRGGDLEVGQGF